jgi:hypothetical protein
VEEKAAVGGERVLVGKEKFDIILMKCINSTNLSKALP